LLFGVRTSTSGGMVTPDSHGWTKSLGDVKGISDSIAGTSAATSNLDSCNETRFESLRGLKQVYKNYRVTGKKCFVGLFLLLYKRASACSRESSYRC
jgi:hypothetical protein